MADLVIDLADALRDFNLAPSSDGLTEAWENKLALAFDPSGERLAIGGGETVRVYDTLDGRLIAAHRFVYIEGEYEPIDPDLSSVEPVAILELQFALGGEVVVAHGVYPFVLPQGDLHSVLRAFRHGTSRAFLNVCADEPRNDTDDGCHAWAVSLDGAQLMAVTNRGSAVYDLGTGAVLRSLDVFDLGDPYADRPKAGAFVGEPSVFADDGAGSLAGWLPWGWDDANQLVYLPDALRSWNASARRSVPNAAGWTMNVSEPVPARPKLAFSARGDALIAAHRAEASDPDPAAVWWPFGEGVAKAVPLAAPRARAFCPYQIDAAHPAVWWSDAASGTPEISVVRQSLPSGDLRIHRVASPGGLFRGAALCRDGTMVARAVDDRVYVHRLPRAQ